MARRRGQNYRYYLAIVDEWGPERPLGVLRVRGRGGMTGEERLVCGATWRPAKYAVETANRISGYSALEVDAATAERAARRWAFTYHRITERSSGRTVAIARVCAMPAPHEQSTCRSGNWEHTERLQRIEQGLDDFLVEPIGAEIADQYVRDLTRPEYRYFALVTGISDTDFGLANPAEVLRVPTGNEDGPRERLAAGMTWEPFDMIDGAHGLRRPTLLEIDQDAVTAMGRRRADNGPAQRSPDYTYFAMSPEIEGSAGAPSAEVIERARSVVRQWRTSGGLQEEALNAGPRWSRSTMAGQGTRETDGDAVEVPESTVRRMMARWGYTYFAIIPDQPDADEPLAVVRSFGDDRHYEHAAISWPVWDSSCWLQQITAGKIRYRAEEVDAATVERFLRRAAANAAGYRYFAILDEGESIDKARRMVRSKCLSAGGMWPEETPTPDGRWVRSYTMADIGRGTGNWSLTPVEVPESLFERYRAALLASAS